MVVDDFGSVGAPRLKIADDNLTINDFGRALDHYVSGHLIEVSPLKAAYFLAPEASTESKNNGRIDLGAVGTL